MHAGQGIGVSFKLLPINISGLVPPTGWFLQIVGVGACKENGVGTSCRLVPTKFDVIWSWFLYLNHNENEFMVLSHMGFHVNFLCSNFIFWSIPIFFNVIDWVTNS